MRSQANPRPLCGIRCLATAMPEPSPMEQTILRVKDMQIRDEHVTVHEDDSLRDTSRKMYSARFGIALVVGKDERVVGILRSETILEHVLAGKDIAALKTREIMDARFTEVEEHTELRELTELLKEDRHHFFIVTDVEGRYVGFFSTGDLRHARELVRKLTGRFYPAEGPRSL